MRNCDQHLDCSTAAQLPQSYLYRVSQLVDILGPRACLFQEARERSLICEVAALTRNMEGAEAVTDPPFLLLNA